MRLRWSMVRFRHHAASGGILTVAIIAPQFPSASDWTTSRVIDLGDLAKYFWGSGPVAHYATLDDDAPRHAGDIHNPWVEHTISRRSSLKPLRALARP